MASPEFIHEIGNLGKIGKSAMCEHTEALQSIISNVQQQESSQID
jgi:hypothetical protein